MEFCPYIPGIDNDRRVWSSNVEMLPAPDISDDDLTIRLRAGDEDAFTFVFRRWQGPLFRFALHMSGNRTLAEDATQEVFMTLIRQTAQFDSAKGKLGAFLFGIALHGFGGELGRGGGFGCGVHESGGGVGG
jgi:hypothetical protein